MKILALETSARGASCAVTENGQILARAASHVALTHSQTLLPMVQTMLEHAALKIETLDAMAVAAGPGSFTGVRIGVAALKGLAFAYQTPCVPVSTLAAMVHPWQEMPFNGRICALMDARCQQVYTALFRCENGVITRLTPDEALPAGTVRERLAKDETPVLLVGDGAEMCFRQWQETMPYVRLAPVSLRLQDAVGVALEAEAAVNAGQTVPPNELLPHYLRLPQAERELKARQKQD